MDTQVDPPIDDPGSNIYSEANLHQDLKHPILYLCKASNDQDTVYMHEALKVPDSLKFKEAMVKEVNEHIKRHNWELMLKRDLPKGTIILLAVWVMTCKFINGKVVCCLMATYLPLLDPFSTQPLAYNTD
jgi:hypothetical protein